MSNRILKESICVSETLNELSWFEEVCFYRLIVNCDDYGCMDARPKILKAKLFPLKDIRTDQIVGVIAKFALSGIVEVYYFDGRPYLRLAKWDLHQRVRAKMSKYPKPTDEGVERIAAKNTKQISDVINGHWPLSDDVIGGHSQTFSDIGGHSRTSADIGGHLLSDDSECLPNPIQSESNPNTNPNPNPNPNPKDTARARATSRPGFDEFWAAYPRKDGKKPAEIAYNQIDVPVEELLSAIERQKQSVQWRKEGGKYIPLPATWLHQRRWEDEGVKLDSQNDSYSDNDWQQFYQEGWQ